MQAMNEFAWGLSLSGLVLREGAAWGRDARSALVWACGQRARAVQIDATMPGMRPRELDASARRDIRALARRSGASVCGVDAFIPIEHFASAAHVDRAVAAVVGAMELARDCAENPGNAVVATSLPADVTGDALQALRAAAAASGVTLADCSWPSTHAGEHIDIGIDPAAVLASGGDVVSEVAKRSATPAHARLSDLGSEGRVEAGVGRLDVFAYAVTLATKAYARPIVIDLRGLRDQAGAVARTSAKLGGT
jgi:hypothetical protein